MNTGAPWSLRDTRTAILTGEVHDNREHTLVVFAVHPERDIPVEGFEGRLGGELECPQLTRRSFRSGSSAALGVCGHNGRPRGA